MFAQHRRHHLPVQLLFFRTVPKNLGRIEVRTKCVADNVVVSPAKHAQVKILGRLAPASPEILAPTFRVNPVGVHNYAIEVKH
jgi:hypothetical protein